MKLHVLDEELYQAELSNGFQPSYPGDAGIDLRARENTVVSSGRTLKIPLGVVIAIPPGCVGWMTGRSSTALEQGLFTHEGKIDAGYRGEVHAFVTAQRGSKVIRRGDRIAQLVVVRIERAENWEVSDGVRELGESTRGERGLGSTGVS